MTKNLLFVICLLPGLLSGLSWYYNNDTSMEFDGTQAQYVHFPSHGLIPESGDFTLSVWVQADPNQVESNFEILAQRNRMIGAYIPYWDPGRAHFYLGGNAAGHIRVGDDWSDTGVPFPMDGKWHNITVVKSTSDCVLYIDGRFKASKGSSIRNPIAEESWIGKQFYFGLLYQYTEYFTGSIDEIKVWDVALSAHEVRTWLHDTLSFNNPNVFTYIQFNESSSTILEAHHQGAVIQGNLINSPAYTMGYAPVGGSYVDHMIIDTNGTHTFSNGVTLHVGSCIGAHVVYVHKAYQRDEFYRHTDDKNYYIYDYPDYGYSSWNIDQIDFQPAQNLGEHYEVYPEHISLLFSPPTMDGLWMQQDTASDYTTADNRVTFNTEVDQIWEESFNPVRRLNFSVVPQNISRIASVNPQDEDITGIDPVLSVEIEHNYYSPGSPATISQVNGNAYLYEDNTLIETLALDNSMISGAAIHFSFQTTLTDGAYYNIRLDNGAIIDDQGLPVVGLTGMDDWNIHASANPPQGGNCILLNGQDSWCEIPDEAAFDLTGDMTVEAWIKVNAFTAPWQAIVTKGDSSWRLHRNNDTNQINFFAGNASLHGSVDVNDGQWHHLAGVKDGNQLFLYIDGRLDATSGCGETSTNDFPVCIGENYEAYGRSFDGSIDDVRVWSTARSLQEIREHMHHPVDPGTRSLLGYWKFDESTSEPGYDSAGGHHGTKYQCLNMVSTAPLAEGASGMIVIDNPGQYPLLDGESVTVSASSYPASIMLSRLNSPPSGLPEIETLYDNQYWIFENFDSATSTVSLTLKLEQSFPTSAPNLYKLFNRGRNDTGDWSYQVSATSVSDSMQFLFEGLAQTGQFIFGGETRTPMAVALEPTNQAVDVARSPELVLQFDTLIMPGAGSIHLYNSDDTPVVSIPATGATVQGNTASVTVSSPLDPGGQYYVLVDPEAFTLYGNPFVGIDSPTQWGFTVLGVDHESGRCLSLNGSDGYVQFEEGLIPATGPFTLSLWALADDEQTGYREIVSQSGGAGTNFYLGMSAGGNVRVGDGWSDSGVPFPLDNGWHHYTVVRSETDTHLYIDGYLKASLGFAINNPAGQEFRVGKQYGGHSEYFMGLVDEIKIWDTDLSTHEIRMRMHRTENLSDPPLISYIQFNQPAGNLTDIAGGAAASDYAARAESDIEIGDAQVFNTVITASGSTAVDSSGVILTIDERVADIDAYVTRFTHLPHDPVWDENPFDAQFWVIHLFSDSLFNAGISFIPQETIDPYYETHPDMFTINHQEPDFSYDYWHSYQASSVNPAQNTATLSSWPGNGYYKLSSEIPVTIVSINPPDDSVVPDSVVFAVQFDYMVWLGQGYLRIHRLSDDSLFEERLVSDLPQNGDGDIMYLNPQNTLEPGVTYYVTIEPDCIFGADETGFGGINNNSYWNFTAESTATLDPPDNMTLTRDQNQLALTWDAVQDANSYRILSATEVDGTWTDVTSAGAFSSEYDPGRISWLTPLPAESILFYKVVASTDPESSPTRAFTPRARGSKQP